MTLTKILLAAGTAALIGVAMPSSAQAGRCWFGKCDTGSSSSSTGGDTGGSSGGSSGGDPVRVPEPEQMGLFAMGVAVIGYRLLRGRRKDK